VAAGVKTCAALQQAQGLVQGKDLCHIVTGRLSDGQACGRLPWRSIGKQGKVAWIYHDASYYVNNHTRQRFKATMKI